MLVMRMVEKCIIYSQLRALTIFFAQDQTF
jgi:hypothetical protein